MALPSTLHVISGREVLAQIVGNGEDCVRVVADAYTAHHAGQSVLPTSGFLRLPSGTDRIISLPAYLGGSYDVAGVKWIASVPGNTARGIPRASAVLVLNDADDGYPFACLEASAISAARTAASGVLAAELLAGGRRAGAVGFVGTGRIAAEVARFLLELGWDIGDWRLFDLDSAAAVGFAERLRARTDATVTPVADVADAFADCDVVVVATVAGTPHLDDPKLLAHAPAVIHLSLRDLTPELIASARNYTDDADHAFRENTSLQLAADAYGHRDFLDGTIADLITGQSRRDPAKAAVFSPFGLGVLDIALGSWVYEAVRASGGGTVVADFFAPDVPAL